MEMQKDALQYVAQLAITANSNRVVEHEGRTLLIDQDGEISDFKPNDNAKEKLEVHTLTAVVDYILQTQERQGKRLVVKVDDQDNVTVLGELDGYGRREELLHTHAMHPNFNYDRWLNSEDFIIAMQSQFEDTEDRALIMKLVGNLKEENSQTQTDDGITQVATAKTGVATLSKVVVPNPVTLKPYRTFGEVEQPASNFVFRLHDGMTAGLFESDGGKWRNQAIANIADYLRTELAKVADNVTVLA
ncbi:hypothetical protein [Lacticaseibacillus saniviri]